MYLVAYIVNKRQEDSKAEQEKGSRGTQCTIYYTQNMPL